MTTIPSTYRQESTGSCYLINPPPFDYSAPYWGKDGRSTLEEQRFNVHGFKNENGMTKSENVLLHCIGTSILEIGCAPGSFLRLAVEQGFECLGIAPEKGLSQAINAHCGCQVIEGFFPDAIKDSDRLFDNVVAMDVFEHIEDGKVFIENCMKRLLPNGRLILMIPMLTDEDEFRPQDFCDEHVVIYHKKHLEEWLKPVVFDTWITGHTIFVVEKKTPEVVVPEFPMAKAIEVWDKASETVIGFDPAYEGSDTTIKPLAVFDKEVKAEFIPLSPIMESPAERDES